MKLDSHAQERVLDPMDRAFDLAVDDTLADAKREASKHRRTGKFEGSLERTDAAAEGDRLIARIGSPLVSAKAKEKGAYIHAKRGKYLVFKVAGGVRKVEAVRLAPQPAVTPAGGRFPRFMAARLVEALGR